MIPKSPQLGVTEGFVNISSGDNIAFRLPGPAVGREGYNEEGTTDADHMSFRPPLLMEASNKLSGRIAPTHWLRIFGELFHITVITLSFSHSRGNVKWGSPHDWCNTGG